MALQYHLRIEFDRSQWHKDSLDGILRPLKMDGYYTGVKNGAKTSQTYGLAIWLPVAPGFNASWIHKATRDFYLSVDL